MLAHRIFQRIETLCRSLFRCLSLRRRNIVFKQEENPWWVDTTPEKLTERLLHGDEKAKQASVEWLYVSGEKAIPVIHFLLSQEQGNLDSGTINQNLLAEIIRIQLRYLHEAQNGVPVLVQFIKKSEKELSVHGHRLPGAACQATFEVLNALTFSSIEVAEQIAEALLELLTEASEHLRFMLLQTLADAIAKIRDQKPKAAILDTWHTELQLQIFLDHERETTEILGREFQEYERSREPLQLRGPFSLFQQMVTA